jgi:hypothetical protein
MIHYGHGLRGYTYQHWVRDWPHGERRHEAVCNDSDVGLPPSFARNGKTASMNAARTIFAEVMLKL